MKKKKDQKIVEKGRIYVVATFNNTMVTITDEKGSPIVTGSSGRHGFA
ncbi:MAG: 30S ribosomal protein S11, partial [Microgenomates group bacterium]